MRSRTLVLALFVLSLASCSGRRTDTRIIPEEAFVKLYADMMIGREEESLRGSGEASPSAADSLYRAYGVSAPEVAYTLKRYQADLPTWKQFHEKVARRLELLQQEMASKRIHR